MIKIINKMKVILDNIKIEHFEYNKKHEMMNWPNSFDLFRWESILSIYFNFINYDYMRAMKDDEEYMLLIANLELIDKNSMNIDPYKIIEKYDGYVVVIDIKKISKGPFHKKWMIDIIDNEKLDKETIFLNKNFILEKIENHKKYYQRYKFYIDFFEMKKASKSIIKNGEFPFIGKFKIKKNDEYISLNDSVNKPFYQKYNTQIYGDHVKVNGIGIIYNIVYYLKSKNVSMNDIHLCFTFNTNNIKFYLEIISNNANLLDEIINSFFKITEQNFMEYDIIETDNSKIDISNMIVVYNMIDCKSYTIYNKFS